MKLFLLFCLLSPVALLTLIAGIAYFEDAFMLSTLALFATILFPASLVMTGIVWLMAQYRTLVVDADQDLVRLTRQRLGEAPQVLAEGRLFDVRRIVSRADQHIVSAPGLIATQRLPATWIDVTFDDGTISLKCVGSPEQGDRLADAIRTVHKMARRDRWFT